MRAHLEPASSKLLHVRLRFLGEQIDRSCRVAPMPVQKGEVRDVCLSGGGLADLNELVEKWLGCPGEWRMNNVANWPLSEEALQRPTSAACPMVVNVVNRTEKVKRDVDSLQDRLKDLEEKVNSLVQQKTSDQQQLSGRLDKLTMIEEYWDLMTADTDSAERVPQVRSGRSRRCWALVVQPSPVFFPVLLFALTTGLWWMSRTEVQFLEHDVKSSEGQYISLERKSKHIVSSVNSQQRKEHEYLVNHLDIANRDMDRLHSNISNLSKWLGYMTELQANVSNISTWLVRAEARDASLRKDQHKLSGKMNLISNQMTQVEEDEGKLSSKLRDRLHEMEHEMQAVKEQVSALQLADEAERNQSQKMQEEMARLVSTMKPEMLRANRTVQQLQKLEKESAEANRSWTLLSDQVSEVQDHTLPDLRTAVANQASTIARFKSNMSSWHHVEEKYSQKGVDAERKVNMVEKEVQKSLQKTTVRLQQLASLQSLEHQLRQQQLHFSERLESIEAKLHKLVNATEAS